MRLGYLIVAFIPVLNEKISAKSLKCKCVVLREQDCGCDAPKVSREWSDCPIFAINISTGLFQEVRGQGSLCVSCEKERFLFLGLLCRAQLHD